MTILLLEWVITATFLILVVLGLRAALGKRISARLRYALWAVVLVRLLIPVQLFTSPLAGTRVFTGSAVEQNIYRVTDDGLEKGGPEDIAALGVPDGPSVSVSNFPQAPAVPELPDAPTVPEPPAAPDLTKAPAWLGWAWLGGAAAAALVMLWSNLRFARRLRRCRAQLDGADCPLPVYAAVGLPSPCLFGVLRPAVYVTPETAASPDMLRHVIAHEYTHFRQGDHIWSFLRCAALAAHWWNPLVWLAVGLSRRDGELSCDEGALRRLGDGERAAYGNTLLTLVTAKPHPGDLLCFATTMAGDKKSLRERITRIAAAPKRWLWAAVAVVLVTALACLCAFGQKEAADEPEPDASVEPSEPPSEDPLYRVTGFEARLNDVEIAFDCSAVNPASSVHIPEDILERARLWVLREFDWDAPGGVMNSAWKEYNKETDEWEAHGDPDIRAYFDGARISALKAVRLYQHGNAEYTVYSISYEYHTTTPDAVKEGKLLHQGPGRYMDEDGWMGMYYPGCTYLLFRNKSDGSHSYEGMVLSSDQGDPAVPDDDMIRDALFPEPERGEPPEDAFAYPGSTRTHMFYEPDLNRNGIKETVVSEDIYGSPEDYGNRDAIVGQRIGVFEDGELIWWDEGYYAHAGYNAIYTCSLNGEEYLLRYNPVMYGGVCEYSYKLFTLEGNRETAVEQDYVSFDTNLGTYVFTGEFDPEAISNFMDKINHLLYYSTVLMMTDSYLLDSIQETNELTDNLWWLDSWAPVFVRDETRPLYNNLAAYLAAMEPYGIPTVRALDEETNTLQLSYHGMHKQFRALWDQWFQPDPDCQVADVNGDGKDEIVVILNEGHGTGMCEEGLYVFDADTLGQYGTDTLTEDIIGQIRCTGDKDNFYLSGPGMRAAISRSGLGDVPYLADEITLGNIVYYSLEDGKIVCTLGCDASGTGNLYCGSLRVVLDFERNTFQVVDCTFELEAEYAPSPWEPFRQVLLSDEPFTLTNMEGSGKYLSGVAAPTEFTPVELPGGERVVVLKDVQANGAEGYLFLYARDGEVFGLGPIYLGSPSSNGCRVDLKTDGTLVVNEGPGMDGEVLAVNTEIESFEVVTAHTQDALRSTMAEYYAEGEPATEEEYRAALEKAAAKKDAFWYKFREDTINKLFS